MLTSDNYKQLMLEYRVLKQLAKDSMTASQFVDEIKKKSPIGLRFLKFFEKITDGKDILGAIQDFIDVVYGVKVVLKTDKKSKKTNKKSK